jgi:N utilization substance protein B
MGLKRRTRELALQMLFQMDLGTVQIKDLEENFIPNASAPEAAKEMAVKLIKNIWDRVSEIDSSLRKYTEHWDLSRMAGVDRNVLRIGAYEILFDPEIPKSVAINEALEIVKRYSTEESSRFVNGILDKLEKQNGETLESPIRSV